MRGRSQCVASVRRVHRSRCRIVCVLQIKTSVLGKMDIDEGPDAPPIGVQLASALRSQSARVLDLFRDWDTDGDGEVSRKEFHKAMTALGLEVPHRSRAHAHPLIAC